MTDDDALKLSVYLGEREHVGGRLLADQLIEIYARHGLDTSLLLRGIEGFGIKHGCRASACSRSLKTCRSLALAVDRPERIEAALGDVREVSGHGLITLERARSAGRGRARAALAPRRRDGQADPVRRPSGASRRAARARRRGRVLHRHGLGGASVLLGLDGTAHGARRRARLPAPNGQVPMMIISVGEERALARALPELRTLLERPPMLLERVLVCKRDGVLLAEPHQPPIAAGPGLAYWQKLVVYTSEDVRHGGAPLYSALVRRLRREGAAGRPPCAAAGAITAIMRRTANASGRCTATCRC